MRKNIFVASNTHEYVAKETFHGTFCCRAAYAARGLKPYGIDLDAADAWSRRVCGAWIETPRHKWERRINKSRRVCGAWIETIKTEKRREVILSRRVCGAWIETQATIATTADERVAPRMRRVD